MLDDEIVDKLILVSD